MTHANITHIDGNTMAVRMDMYNARLKDEVKALAGAIYENGAWLLSPMHLSRLKPLFSRMTVEPAVVEAYHAALCRMMDDLSGSLHRKGALGQHIAEVMELHAAGIAAIRAKGYVQPLASDAKKEAIERPIPLSRSYPTPTNLSFDGDTPVKPSEALLTSKAIRRDAKNADLAVWLQATQNAVKKEERKADMLRRKRQKIDAKGKIDP